MEVVQIRREAQSSDRALNVLVNVCGRIGDFAVLENRNTALACHCSSREISKVRTSRSSERRLTEDLVADVVLPDKVSKNLLIHTVAVGYLGKRSAG